MNKFMCVYAYTCMYIQAHVSLCVYVYVCMCISVCVDVFVCVCMHGHGSVCLFHKI